MSSLLLADGPFDGQRVAWLPPNIAAPAQIVWAGWLPWGIAAYVYEWHGERATVAWRDALVYRFTGRRIAADDMPPLIAEDAELWANGAAMIMGAYDVPAELIWPGV
jgi:hypothetical protein